MATRESRPTIVGRFRCNAVPRFLDRVQTGNNENVAERSALSTMIAILGRTAVYSGQEVTWKGLYGVYG